MAKAVKAALTVFVVSITAGVALSFLPGGFFAGMALVDIAMIAATSAAFAFVSTGIGMLTQKGIDATIDNFGIKQTIKGAANPRQIVYGETVVGGTLGYISTSGTDNTKLHMIIMLAGHEIQSLEKLRINGIDATTSSSTVSGETVYRVTNADFVNTENPSSFTSGSLFRYTFHNGASDQSADGLAVANLNDFTSNHRLRGIAYVYIECIFDREKWSGFPQITAKIKGKKVYDPRNSSTAWSANPALCIRDYLMDTANGVGATSDEINDANVAGSFYTAANTCDTDIATTGGATEDKYTLNGFFNTSSEPQAVIEGMLSSCAGKIAYSNGKFNLFVGEAQTASLTITDDELLSAIDIQSNRGDSHNGVKAIYVDKDNNYQSGDMPPYQDSTFLNADTPTGGSTANFEKYMELQYPFTQSQFTAQRLGRIALKNSRQSMVISCLVNMGFYRLQVGDWVKVTNSRMSFTNKVFEVQAVGFEVTEDNFMATRLVLKENASSVFTFDTDNDYVDFATTGSTPTTGGTDVPPPTNLSLTASSEFVVGTTAVLVSWTKAVSSIVTQTELEYKKTAEADSTYISAVPVPYAAQQQRAVLTGLTPNTGYTVRIRSYSSYYDNHSTRVTGTVTTGGTVVSEDDIANDQLSLVLNGQDLTLTNGGGSAQTFSNASVGLSNVTNHTQVKSDGSNAPNILKNDQISLSASGGTVTLNNASSSNNTFDKSSISLGNVADVDQTNASNISSGTININRTPTTVRNSQITTNANGTLNYDGTTATAPSLASITGVVPKSGGGFGTSMASSTGVVRFASGTLNTDTTLSTTYTDATDNGTTINTSGNIVGNMSVGATMTLGTSSGNKIVCGNVTIDGQHGRILIED